MISRKLVGTLFLGLVLSGRVCAGNEALGEPQTITAGERVANYLQSMMISVSAVLESKKPGDIMGNPEVYRVGVTYDPQEKVIELSVVGIQADPKIAQDKLELTRKLVLSFNPKIQRNFGVTLGENDFVMDYLNAKTNHITLKYRDGKFLAQPIVQEVVTPGLLGSLEH